LLNWYVKKQKEYFKGVDVTDTELDKHHNRNLAILREDARRQRETEEDKDFIDNVNAYWENQKKKEKQYENNKRSELFRRVMEHPSSKDVISKVTDNVNSYWENKKRSELFRRVMEHPSSKDIISNFTKQTRKHKGKSKGGMRKRVHRHHTMRYRHHRHSSS
jgi:hypothetical protein